MTTTLYLVTGDNKATRSWVVRNGPDSTSTPIDLTNASAVEMHIVGAANPTLACTFLADTTGTVSRVFLVADIPTAGAYQFETQITFNDATVATVPDPGFDTLIVRTQGG